MRLPDVDDFSDFYAARKDTVFRTVAVALGDRVAAEDAVSEAFTRACAGWSRVKEHPNPTAWVLRVALNAQRSWWRRGRREVPGEVPETPTAEAGSAALPVDLRAAVARLPQRQREVVALRVLADLSADEAGALLGIAPATVHVHLHRALETLRRELSASDYAGDRFQVAESAVRRQARTLTVRRRAMAAAAVVLVLAATVSGLALWRGGGPGQSADRPGPTPEFSFGKPPRPSTSATTDDGRCREIAMQLDPQLMELPPLRFERVAGPLRLRLYGGLTATVVCWATDERIDIGGPAMNLDPATPDLGLTYASMGQGTGPAAVAFGQLPPGATRVELSRATGGPLVAELHDGWWIYFVPDATTGIDLAEVTRVTAATPTGDHALTITHG
ncbi:RNA polymerase sigma factor (sigma-70 family) [Allocatelliglobosispora scoriae]|uniref:RNA polymerase sigma factor (Sigma-70 family) n=1 Tax=Allocatelliglobosispora scoriae TaxID=643052 RepID=A0A841BXY3_9ACTN|nr:SigE family RNA polymerase sigma factor [Allocatelliglobosispora scoriae]MBB5872525.1 RNA polymerase sigma factor (sigma-70 family) [Allocatelliglobosispora scoriae]